MNEIVKPWIKNIFLSLFLTSIILPQTTKWYISPTGSGTQDGKSRQNARIYTNTSTLAIQPGDTVFAVEGVYNGQFVFRKSGAPGALITIMPDPQNTGEAIFRHPTEYAIDINTTSYVRLKNLIIRNTNRGVAIGRGKVKFLDSLHISKCAGTGINVYGSYGSGYNPAYNPGMDSQVDSVFIRWCFIATDTQTTAQTDNINIYWAHGVRIIGNYILQGNYTGDGHNDCIQTGHGLGDIYISDNILINLKQGNSQIFMNGNSWAGYKTVIYNNVAIHYGAGVGMWQTYAYNGWNPNGAIADSGDGEIYAIHNTLIGRRIPFVVTTNRDPYNSNVRLDSLYAVNNIFYMIQSDGTRTFGVPRKATDTYDAMYSDNNIHAINGGSSTKHIEASYGNLPAGNWTLTDWNNLYFSKMLNSTTLIPTFTNFIYDAGNYTQENLSLASGSVGIGQGRTNIKIKGNQWVNLKTLIESFGLEWKSMNNPYLSWATGVARSEVNPTIGACEFTDGTGGNLPPDEPSNPAPANGSQNQPTALTLSWSCSDPNGDPLLYDIYFGTGSNPDPVAVNHQNNTYNISNLNSNTTYYWRVVAKDNKGAFRSGAVWQFSTSSIDTTPPRLISASLVNNITLSLNFSENIDPSNATNPVNYSINNGVQVSNVVLNGSSIRLTTSEHSAGFYEVTVNNIRDLSGNLILPPFNIATYGYNPDTLLNTIKFTPFNVNASSVPDPTLNPNKTIDGLGYNSGDPNTRWAAAGLPQWIGYDLGDLKMLNKIRIQFFRFSERSYQYSVQVSQDSIIWQEILSNISSVQGAEWDERIIEPHPARFIRIVINNNSAQNNWASLWEAEFYGQIMVTNSEDYNIVSEYTLYQNYPNPFNPTTKISWQSPIGSHQTLKVYDVLGNEVATLVDEYREAGKYEVEFNAADTRSGVSIPSGVYIYRLQAGTFSETKKMILLR